MGGNAIAGAASALQSSTNSLVSQAARADKKASLVAQLQDRRFQANATGRSIKSIDKQVEIQNINIKSIQKQIEMQKSEVEDANGTLKWLRTKYTNEQLYTWIEKTMKNLYFQAYDLTLTTALRAESALDLRRSSH